jgi:hypothetical protein
MYGETYNFLRFAVFKHGKISGLKTGDKMTAMVRDHHIQKYLVSFSVENWGRRGVRAVRILSDDSQVQRQQAE